MFPLYFLYDMWPVLILRIALGAVFIVHGWSKMRDLRQNAKNFDAMGFKPGKLFGTVAALLEFFGGIALLIGLGTTWVAGLFILEFIVIILWRWAKHMPFVGGWELDLLILAGVIILFLSPEYIHSTGWFFGSYRTYLESSILEMVNKYRCSDPIVRRRNVSHSRFGWAKHREPGVGVACITRYAWAKRLGCEFELVYGNCEPVDALVSRVALR